MSSADRHASWRHDDIEATSTARGVGASSVWRRLDRHRCFHAVASNASGMSPPAHRPRGCERRDRGLPDQREHADGEQQKRSAGGWLIGGGRRELIRCAEGGMSPVAAASGSAVGLDSVSKALQGSVYRGVAIARSCRYLSGCWFTRRSVERVEVCGLGIDVPSAAKRRDEAARRCRASEPPRSHKVFARTCNVG